MKISNIAAVIFLMMGSPATAKTIYDVHGLDYKLSIDEEMKFDGNKYYIFSVRESGEYLMPGPYLQDECRKVTRVCTTEGFRVMVPVGNCQMDLVTNHKKFIRCNMDPVIFTNNSYTVAEKHLEGTIDYDFLSPFNANFDYYELKFTFQNKLSGAVKEIKRTFGDDLK